MTPVEVVERYLETNDISKSEPLIAGVSGGPDSTALLLALHEIGCKRVHVLHVNYAKRGSASDEDATFVRSLATALAYPCAVFDARMLPEARDTRRGFQHQARGQRFAFFEAFAKETGVRHLMVAHHADDRLETILLQWQRGVRSLSSFGIPSDPERRGSLWIHHPFLSLRKEDILDWLQVRAQPYRRDESNDQPLYKRNEVRGLIGAYLEPRLPNASVNASRWITHMQRVVGDLTDVFQDHYVASLPWLKGARISNQALSQLGREARSHVLWQVIGRLRHVQRSTQLSERLLDALSWEAGKRLLVHPDVLVFQTGGGLDVVLDPAVHRPIAESTYTSSTGDKGRLDAPLVRKPKPGDRVTATGRPTKSLTTLLASAGIPCYLRDGWPVIADGGGGNMVRPLRPRAWPNAWHESAYFATDLFDWTSYNEQDTATRLDV